MVTIYSPPGTTFQYLESLASGDFRVSFQEGRFHVKISTGVRFEFDPNLTEGIDVKQDKLGVVNSPRMKVMDPLPPPGGAVPYTVIPTVQIPMEDYPKYYDGTYGWTITTTKAPDATMPSRASS